MSGKDNKKKTPSNEATAKKSPPSETKAETKPKETPKDKPKETPKQTPKETPKETPKQTPKETPKPTETKAETKPKETKPKETKTEAKSESKTPVPESVLKRRKRAEESKDDRLKKARALHKAKVAKRKDIFKRAEKYVKEYREQRKNLVTLKRLARNRGNFYMQDEPKVAFVLRIRGINRVAPKTRKILQLLRLRQLHNGVFVKLNKATLNMLRLVEPYITYGPPSLKSIRELIYKRGFVKSNHTRQPIHSNAIIERHLGKYNIICIEDLIHEIYTCGPHFREANNLLWPFKLSSPVGGFSQKSKHFAEGGDAGNREEYINNLIRRMN